MSFKEDMFNLVNKLSKENKQLKQVINDYGSSDVSFCMNTIFKLAKENKQLKKDVEYWKQVESQYDNELNVFEHCKKYKTECKDIHWNSD